MSILVKKNFTEGLEEHVKDFLERATIQQLEIQTRSKRILMTLKVPYWPAVALKAEISRYLQGCYPADVRLDIKMVCKDLAALGDLLQEPKLFLAYLAEDYPQLTPWLSECDFCDGAKGLQVHVHSDMVFRRLEKAGTQRGLAQWLEERGRTGAMVTLVRSDVEEPPAEPLNILKEEPRPAPVVPSCRNGVSPASVATGAKGAHIIYGRTINQAPVDIADITEEENKVCCAGRLFDIDGRELKSDRGLIVFSITDQTDSIECRLFCDKKEVSDLLSQLKSADGVCLNGRAQVDRYSQELVLMVNNINHKTLACRIDQATEKRVELHLHTQMSNMDGVSSLKTLVSLAAQLGHSAIAITDHGVVQSFPQAYDLGKKLGIKIIYGMEAYIFDDSIPENQKPKTYHCILLAKNMTGLLNLYKLTTESHLRYYKRRPRIPKRLINYAREGLIIGSACEAGELMQYLIHHPDDEAGLEDLAQFYDYVEIQPIDNNAFMIRKDIVSSREDLQDLNRRLFSLGRKLGKPVVATCDVHFANAEDAIFRTILMAGKGFQDAEQQAPLYYRNTDEMLAEFAYLGEEDAYDVVVTAPNRIADQIEEVKPVPDELFPPEIEGAEEEIKRLTYKKAHALYGAPLPDIVEARIEKELKAIIGNGFSVLYLIAHKLVKKSNEDGYLVGSRGSVGSSVVAYFTDITEVNALPPHYRCPACQHSDFANEAGAGTGIDLPRQTCPHCGADMEKDGFDIPFEIFLGFKGDKVPDIDLNFSGEYQPSAHAFTETLFGKDNVFRAGTIATVAEKTAYGYVRKFYEERGEVHRSAEMNRLRNGCTGVKRTTGQHPGGLMVIPKGLDVHQFTPLQRPADDVKTEIVTTHFDYHSINDRLVKLDILGHDDPTVIKMLGDLTGLDARHVPLDDPATMSLFSSTEALGVSPEALGSPVATYGVPEFNTKFTRQMLEDIKPQTFAELLRISGFSHGTDVWLNNAQDLIRSGTATATETISTRDDIMLFLIDKGMDFSLSFKIMESVRKGRGLSEDQHAAMVENHIPDWFIKSCEKIKYLFPKAHAVAYVMMAYRIAWFKINHPLAFYAAYFTVRGADEFDLETVLEGETVVQGKIKNIYNSGRDASAKDKASVSVLEVALELLLRGFHVLPVDIKTSDPTKFTLVDDALLPPLVAIPGLGQTIANSIALAREEKAFISIEDLKGRGKVGEAMVGEMARMGVLKDMPESNQINLF
ncbi:PolC-type DNA polymerase III [Peptococcus simiae]|uniref:PolC-type DNA polymerase III n=1 Tax=Peptococcus simiae TaxID=1643805 RepID=UPI00397F665B